MGTHACQCVQNSRCLTILSRLTPDASLATKYSEDHESVQFDDETKIGTVTITEYAQTSLGDVVFVELPEEGSSVEKGGTCI